MSTGIAVFVKTPGLSPVKTRLAAQIGKTSAVALYTACHRAVAEVVGAAALRNGGQAYFAVAEMEGLAAPEWRSLRRIPQGSGDLGARLARVYGDLLARHHHVLLLGADSPQMTEALLVDAQARLAAPGGPEFLLGPSRDGGFWLFAGRRPLPRELWTSVTYSRPDTCEQLQGRLAGHGTVKFLPALHDLDRRRDMAPILVALADLPHPTPGQRALAELLRDAAAACAGDISPTLSI